MLCVQDIKKMECEYKKLIVFLYLNIQSHPKAHYLDQSMFSFQKLFKKNNIKENDFLIMKILKKEN